jgi:hypothetical protein
MTNKRRCSLTVVVVTPVDDVESSGSCCMAWAAASARRCGVAVQNVTLLPWRYGWYREA